MTSRSSSKSGKGQASSRSGNRGNLSKEAQKKGGEHSHSGRGKK
jgi:hypothetical protein